MKERISRAALLRLLPVAACLVLAACAKTARTDLTASPTPSPQESKTAADGGGQPKPDAARVDGPPPTPAEARAALERVYRRAVNLGGNPPDQFVTGDFNGDGWEDIAVVVGPSKGTLAEINSEFANWIVQDPKKVSVPDPKKRVQPPPPETGPAKIEQRDTLLAIIHGHGREGWRAAEATQSYLLKNAAGAAMRVVPLKDFPPALEVKERGASSRADVITQRLDGREGFLYWTAGKYAWHAQ